MEKSLDGCKDCKKEEGKEMNELREATWFFIPLKKNGQNMQW